MHSHWARDTNFVHVPRACPCQSGKTNSKTFKDFGREQIQPIIKSIQAPTCLSYLQRPMNPSPPRCELASRQADKKPHWFQLPPFPQPQPPFPFHPPQSIEVFDVLGRRNRTSRQQNGGVFGHFCCTLLLCSKRMCTLSGKTHQRGGPWMAPPVWQNIFLTLLGPCRSEGPSCWSGSLEENQEYGSSWVFIFYSNTSLTDQTPNGRLAPISSDPGNPCGTPSDLGAASPGEASIWDLIQTLISSQRLSQTLSPNLGKMSKTHVQ